MNAIEITQCTSEEADIIIDGINNYNKGYVISDIPKRRTPFEFAIKNPDGEIIAGILAGMGCYGGLEINILWVKEGKRQSGIGTTLLLETEKRAKEAGAIISLLDTFDFQAKDFYLKNGYSIFGQVNNFPTGHTRYYLQKRL